jgi:hypothetical protein
MMSFTGSAMTISTETAEAPRWIQELEALPLQDAARAAGVSVATAKRRISARPSMVLFRRASSAGGRPSPYVVPRDLIVDERPDKAKARAFFIHRCKLAGVNPAQAIWRIVTGCLPDADKLADAMRLALSDELGGSINGKPLFLRLVAGVEKVPAVQPPSFVYWLARHILNNASRKMPWGDADKLWGMALIKTQNEGKVIFRRLIPQKSSGKKWTLAESPEYWQHAPAPIFAGERRFLDRIAKRASRGVAKIGDYAVAGGSRSRAANLVSLVNKLMIYAQASPRYPRFSDYLNSANADSYARQALTHLVRDVGLTRAEAMAYLGAYWRRVKIRRNSKLSASAVREIFGMTTRARTGERPERSSRGIKA